MGIQVVLSLPLKPCLSRIVQLAASLTYALTISAAALGETWAHYVVASVAEPVILAVIARTAWIWPSPDPPISTR